MVCTSKVAVYFINFWMHSKLFITTLFCEKALIDFEMNSVFHKFYSHLLKKKKPAAEKLHNILRIQINKIMTTIWCPEIHSLPIQ